MKQQTASKIILVDLDGPLADLEGEFLRRWKEKYPGEFFVSFEKRKTFFLREEYPEHLQPKTDEILREEGFFANLQIVSGSKEALFAMRDRGYTVVICTSDIFSNKSGLRDKRVWIHERFGEEFARAMIFTRDKTLVRGDYLIDDKPLIMGALEPTWEHVIFDQPFNRETKMPKRIRSDWSNWRDVIT
ncbi:MAG: 5'-3'-deoxyribonucleotidase [Patescibacteria group bacterium]